MDLKYNLVPYQGVENLPLSVRKRKDKEYVYYRRGIRTLYLGRSDAPKRERVVEAIDYANRQIKKYEDELLKLEKLLGLEIEKPETLHYKFVIFTLDGVIYEEPWEAMVSDKDITNMWGVVFRELETYDAYEKLKQNLEKGILDGYMNFTEAACSILKSIRLDRKTFQRIIDRWRLFPGAKEVFEVLHAQGVKIALVTPSFEALVQRAIREVGEVEHVLAHCRLNFDTNDLLESWELHPIGPRDRMVFVEEVAKTYDIPLECCAYVSNDISDLEVFQKVGLAIAFNSKEPKLLGTANVAIHTRDLRTVLPHL